MLMMTTIFIGEMQMLPSTAYIKMVDIWLVFCQLVPFTEVIFLIATEYHRGDLKNGDAILVGPRLSNEKPTIKTKVGEMLHDQTVHMALEEPSQGGPGISLEAGNTWLYWLNMLGEFKSKI